MPVCWCDLVSISVQPPLGGCCFWTICVALTLCSTSIAFASICLGRSSAMWVGVIPSEKSLRSKEIASDSLFLPSLVKGRLPFEPQLTSSSTQLLAWALGLFSTKGERQEPTGPTLTFSPTFAGRVSCLVPFRFRKQDSAPSMTASCVMQTSSGQELSGLSSGLVSAKVP